MKKADICIITEGSYPYYPGGVTRWVSELIRERKECTFHILSLLPPHPELSVLPPFPPNVIGHTSFIVQALPAGAPASQTPPLFWQQAGELLKQLISGSPPL
ncbi:MAG: DUF3492 domain-containing protein, partial [Verrucomicrobia bacterium]|nr:DUF3492 domain-containing protein [Verrucomicrobiota bacterium]